MPIQPLTDTERTNLMPTLFVPAESLKRRLDLASPRSVRRSPRSARLEAPARQLQSKLLRVLVSNLIKKRPTPKITVLSPCLARVSRELEMQRKKDAVSRTLCKREPHSPPKIAFSLQSLARQLANRMLRDKVSQQLSPTLRKRTKSTTSLAQLNASLQQSTLSPKALDFSPLLKFAPTLKPVPPMTSANPSTEHVADEAGWEVVTRKSRKKKRAPIAKPQKKKTKGRKRNQRRSCATITHREERKRSGVYPADSANVVPLRVQAWFPSLSVAQKEAHNRDCALRRIMRKEKKTRKEILNRMGARAACIESV